MKRLPVVSVAVCLFGLLTQICWGSELSLERKLEAQWDRYERARLEMLEQGGRQGKLISRKTWESWLAAPDAEIIHDEELSQLRRMQQRRIEQSRQLALQHSAIDLEQVRRLGRVEEFCAQFPKGGMLHVHTWGSLDRATVHLLLQQVNPKIDPQALRESLLNPSAKRGFYSSELDFLNAVDAGIAYSNFPKADQSRLENLFFLPEGHHPFSRFDGIFLFMSMLLDTRPELDSTNLVDTALFERARSEGVHYLELTEGAPASVAELEHLSKRMESAQRDFGLRVRFLAAFDRSVDVEQNRRRALDLLALPPSEALVGINLLSDETNTPALETGQSIYSTIAEAARAGTSQLRLTMHAGELGDVRNPRDALLLGAQRLGHGVKLREDPVTLEFASRRHLPVEVNLVSNWRLEAVDSLEHHPYLDYLRLGLKVSLSTDDEGLLETDINNECVQAIRHTDVAYSELKQMAENSLLTSFAQPLVRDELLALWRHEVKQFEARW